MRSSSRPTALEIAPDEISTRRASRNDHTARRLARDGARVVGLLGHDAVQPLALRRVHVHVGVGAAERALGLQGRPGGVGRHLDPLAEAHALLLDHEAWRFCVLQYFH